MILRIVRGRVESARLAALADSYVSTYVPDAQRWAGLLHFHVGVRPDGDHHGLVSITFWRALEDALRAFAGDLLSPTTLGRIRDVAHFSDADYYEVEEPELRSSNDEAAIVRLAAGRIAPGWGASIQEELRRRVAHVGDEMIEGYVGRRLDSTGSVEVMFASVWSRPPAGRSLDKPMWRDIAGRYDTFEVQTYVPLAKGPKADRS